MEKKSTILIGINIKIWDLIANNDESVFRAYSMANHPAEGNRVMLNVRIATPPPRYGMKHLISFILHFQPKAGDKVTISGPYESFY